MKTKNYVFTSLMVFVAYEAVNNIIHMLILSGVYETMMDVWRTDMMQKLWIMYVTALIFSFLFVYIFSKGYEVRHCNSCSLQTVKVTVELCRTPVLMITNAKHNGSACSTSSGSDYLGIPTDSRNDVRFLLPKEWRTITGQTMSADGAFPRSRYSDECILHTQ
jgi:hypothetical protein